MWAKVLSFYKNVIKTSQMFGDVISLLSSYVFFWFSASMFIKWNILYARITWKSFNVLIITQPRIEMAYAKYFIFFCFLKMTKGHA